MLTIFLKTILPRLCSSLHTTQGTFRVEPAADARRLAEWVLSQDSVESMLAAISRPFAGFMLPAPPLSDPSEHSSPFRVAITILGPHAPGGALIAKIMSTCSTEGTWPEAEAWIRGLGPQTCLQAAEEAVRLRSWERALRLLSAAAHVSGDNSAAGPPASAPASLAACCAAIISGCATSELRTAAAAVELGLSLPGGRISAAASSAFLHALASSPAAGTGEELLAYYHRLRNGGGDAGSSGDRALWGATAGLVVTRSVGDARWGNQNQNQVVWELLVSPDSAMREALASALLMPDLAASAAEGERAMGGGAQEPPPVAITALLRSLPPEAAEGGVVADTTLAPAAAPAAVVATVLLLASISRTDGDNLSNAAAAAAEEAAGPAGSGTARRVRAACWAACVELLTRHVIGRWHADAEADACRRTAGSPADTLASRLLQPAAASALRSGSAGGGGAAAGSAPVAWSPPSLAAFAAGSRAVQLALLDAALAARQPGLGLCAHAALTQPAPARLLEGLYALLAASGLFAEGAEAVSEPGSRGALAGAAAGHAVVCFEGAGEHTKALALFSETLLSAASTGAASAGSPSAAARPLLSAQAAADALATSGLGEPATAAALRSLASTIRGGVLKPPQAIVALCDACCTHEGEADAAAGLPSAEVAAALVSVCAAKGDAAAAVVLLQRQARVVLTAAPTSDGHDGLLASCEASPPPPAKGSPPLSSTLIHTRRPASVICDSALRFLRDFRFQSITALLPPRSALAGACRTARDKAGGGCGS